MTSLKRAMANDELLLEHCNAESRVEPQPTITFVWVKLEKLRLTTKDSEFKGKHFLLSRSV